MIALGLCTPIYALVQFVVVQTLANPAQSDRPLATAAHVFGGPVVPAIIAFGVVISVLGYFAAGMIATPRIVFAFAQQGDFPRWEVYDVGQRLEERLKNACTKLNAGAYDFGAIRIGLQAMLHRTRVKQHAGFPNAKPMFVRLYDVDATLAQKVQVAGSVRLMIIRHPAKLATEKDLRREGEVPEHCSERVHLVQ